MKNRPGERARRNIRAAWLRTVRRNALLWVGLVLILAYCLGLFTVLPMSSTWRAFWIGFAVAATLAAFAWMVESLSATHGRSLGKLGEEATADAVLSWRQCRKGWRLVNGIYLAGHGDVDHVLVGPGGVFVIESKWTSNPCHVEDDRVVGLMGREPISQVRDGTRKIEKLLRYGARRLDVEVRPAVVIWGPGAPHLELGWTIVDGVLVCEGRQNAWVRQLTGSTIERSEIEAIAEVLGGQVTRQVDQPIHSAPPKAKVPPSAAELELIPRSSVSAPTRNRDSLDPGCRATPGSGLERGTHELLPGLPGREVRCRRARARSSGYRNGCKPEGGGTQAGIRTSQHRPVPKADQPATTKGDPCDCPRHCPYGDRLHRQNPDLVGHWHRRARDRSDSFDPRGHGSRCRGTQALLLSPRIWMRFEKWILIACVGALLGGPVYAIG